MLKDKKLLSLYLFYFVFFIGQALTTFAGKYYGEIGLTDSQIGLINALPAFVAIFVQPLWGSLSDRVRHKRSVVTGVMIIAAGISFLVRPVSGCYPALLVVVTLLNTFNLPVYPITNAIAIEYTSSVGRGFGPARMMGTVGYEIMLFTAGFIFTASLTSLYNAYAVTLILGGLCAMLLPPVKGYQHDKEKISFTVFLKDKNLMLLFSIVFIAQICNQFYLSFFSKHLGDLGVSNSLTGIMTGMAVMLEIPFLMFGDRIMRHLSIWTWFIIGLICNGVRFLLLGTVTSTALMMLAQIPTVTMLAIFEFYPAIYLSNNVDKELRGTVQNTYQLISGGIAKITGTLIGGAIAGATGIMTMFTLLGSMLMITAVVLFVPLRNKARAEKA